MGVAKDREFSAMKRISIILEGLSTEARRRVLQYVADKYLVHPQMDLPHMGGERGRSPQGVDKELAA